jgi:DNA-directed RNA polymerase specialized sigma24 family protein
MPSAPSVTVWLRLAEAGDAAAVEHLWERYFQRLVGLARKKLRGAPRRVADEEDVALSAFDSFYRGIRQGRFPHLRDRDNLWGLLIVITARKALDQVRHAARRKRGGGRVQGDSAFPTPAGCDEAEAGLDQVVGREPSPEFAALVAEEYERLLDQLDDPELRQVALWKMEGYSTEEVAARLGRVPRTVERKLRVIRGIWSREVPS